MDYSQILQLQLRPDTIDLVWGHPDLQLLPNEAIASAAQRALARWGGVMLTYGIDHGVAPLREQLEQMRRHQNSPLPIRAPADEPSQLVFALCRRLVDHDERQFESIEELDRKITRLNSSH